MTEQSARLGLPYIQPSQAQKHITHNEAVLLLDLLVQLVVEEFAAPSPPALPEEGRVWGLGPAPTDAWAGQAGMLAAWDQGGWLFIAPQTGWRAWGQAEAELRIWDGSEWVGDGLDNRDGLGINASHDATNRLAVSSPATLLTHEGAGHQLKINKATAANTASVLFQTGWSGRAEMGLAGEDDLSFKVSRDGAAWNIGLRIAATTGQVQFPNGAHISGLITGDAVTQSPTDRTPGRLLRAADAAFIEPIIVTVGATGDFLTVVDACEELSAMRAGFRTNASFPATVTILSGEAIETQLIVNGLDLSWIQINSQDPEVTIVRAALTQEIGGFFPALAALFGQLPFMDISLVMDESGPATGRDGIRLFANGRCAFGYERGLRNAGGSGMDAGIGCLFVGNRMDVSGAKGQYGIRANAGAQVQIGRGNARKGVSDSSTDIVCGGGSMISAVGATGGTNITPNTVTGSGIIFK